MKLLLSLITAAVVLANVGHVRAASSVDVSVKGSITPAACTPTLTNGGVVDHGKRSIKDLKPNSSTALPVATLQVNVNCSASTLFALKATDNREGTAANPGFVTSSYFGLGLFNDVKVGWYTLKMNSSLADGLPKAVIESNDGRTWMNAPDGSQVWQPNWLRAFEGGSVGASTPLPVTNLDADIMVEAHIISGNLLPANQEIPIDGSATLDVVYL